MSEISMTEYKKSKDQLEKFLTVQIAESIAKFEHETGVNVHDVYVGFTDATSLGGPEKHIITCVTVRTEFSD